MKNNEYIERNVLTAGALYYFTEDSRIIIVCQACLGLTFTRSGKG